MNSRDAIRLGKRYPLTEFGALSDFMSAARRAGQRVSRNPAGEMEKVSARVEAAMLGSEGKVTKRQAREIIRGIAGNDAASSAVISPRVSNRYNPLAEAFPNLREALKKAPPQVRGAVNSVVGAPIHAQPIAGVVAHEATHMRQNQMAGAAGGKIASSLARKLGAGDAGAATAESFGTLAGKVGITQAYGAPVHPVVEKAVAGLHARGMPKAAAAVSAASHGPQLAMEGHANLAALKHPGGGRVAAVSQGSYTAAALQRIKRAYRGEKELSSRDQLNEIIQLSSCNYPRLARAGISPGMAADAKKMKKRTGEDPLKGLLKGAIGLSAREELDQIQFGFGDAAQRFYERHPKKVSGAASALGATAGIASYYGLYRLYKHLKKPKENQQALSARDQLDTILFGTDPRPRNNLGMFSQDGEQGPNPNAVHEVYKRPAPQAPMPPAAPEEEAVPPQQGGVRGLIGRVRSGEVKMSARDQLDSIIQL